MTQSIIPCCPKQGPGPPSPKIKYGLSSCSSKFIFGGELRKDRSELSVKHVILQDSTGPRVTRALENPPLYLTPKQPKYRVSFSAIFPPEEPGKMAAGSGPYHHLLLLVLTRSHGCPSPEAMHTALAAAPVLIILEGVGPDRHNGREWPDHTHDVCVSADQCQLAACVVDPVSQAPDSRLHQGSGKRIAHQRYM